jgi:hypothetical protein
MRSSEQAVRIEALEAEVRRLRSAVPAAAA